jgi:hypothetical protein
MQVHKKFIDKIIEKREATVRDLIEGEGSLRFEYISNVVRRLDQMDQVEYTINFLDKQNLIEVKKMKNSRTSDLFKFSFEALPKQKQGQAKYLSTHFNEGVMGWHIKVNPGIIAFANKGYRTDDDIRDDKNFRIAVGVSLLSAFITAIFTTYLGELLEQFASLFI